MQCWILAAGHTIFIDHEETQINHLSTLGTEQIRWLLRLSRSQTNHLQKSKFRADREESRKLDDAKLRVLGQWLPLCRLSRNKIERIVQNSCPGAHSEVHLRDSAKHAGREHKTRRRLHAHGHSDLAMAKHADRAGLSPGCRVGLSGQQRRSSEQAAIPKNQPNQSRKSLRVQKVLEEKRQNRRQKVLGWQRLQKYFWTEWSQTWSDLESNWRSQLEDRGQCPNEDKGLNSHFASRGARHREKSIPQKRFPDV